MTSKINAITTGAGGIEVTGDSSGEIEFQADGSTIATITSSGLSLTGTLPIADGGTGQTTATSAFNALAPSQSTHSGKFLTTDGTNTSWATVAQYSLPDQTGNSGKYLTTDGTNESWADVTAGIEDNGTFTTLTVSGGATIKDVTGDYGSVEIDGGATGTWEGYNIGGESVYMCNGSISGIYNDANNQWIMYGNHGAQTRLFYAGAEKFATTSNGATVSGNLYFNSGFGSNGIAYGCRAWVKFRGNSTVLIRADGNVSSVTDLGTGNYRVNFSSAMPDANYCAVGATDDSPTVGQAVIHIASTATTSVTVHNNYTVNNSGNTFLDSDAVHVAIFR